MVYSIWRIGDQVRPVTCTTDCKYTEEKELRIAFVIYDFRLAIYDCRNDKLKKPHAEAQGLISRNS